MAAWPQSKVANRAAGCNYKPAEDPVWPQTLLEWVSSNLHPFETISLRSASRGHDTEEWKYKNTPQKNTELSQLQHFDARSTLVIYCEHSMEHLGRNRGCKMCCGQAGGGGVGVGGLLLTGPLEKWWQVFTKWQLFWILSIRNPELSRHFHLCFIVSWCGLVSSTPPSIVPVITAFSSWGTSASDCAQVILLLLQFFFFSGLIAKSASWLVHDRCKPSVTTLCA